MKSTKGKTGTLIVLLLLIIAGSMVWFLSVRQGRQSRTGKSGRGNSKAAGGISNVVLISLDTCRADHLSCYGYSRKTTPNIDSIAGEGVLFTHAISPVPLTLPSHSSMLTGTTPIYHKVHDNNNYRLGGWNVTLAEILGQNGFITGAVIGAFVLDSQFGLDQGFGSYDDNIEEKSKEPSIFFNERQGEKVTHQANLWLEEHADDKFFLFLHYFDPHGDYAPPGRFASEYADDLYAGEIAYADHCIGQVIEKLQELGLYDSTLVIITGDHGEMLGEHGESTHGYFIYQSAVRVPLIFKIPGQSTSKTIDHVVGLVDIVPTVCGLLDIEIPAAVQGKDLSEYFGRKQPQAPDRYIYCENLFPTKYNGNTLLGVVSDRWKYIQTTRPELYDIIEDPGETNNLIKEQPQRGRILQDQLKQILEQTVSKDDLDGKFELDAESKRRLESLGYVAGTVVEGYEFNQSKDDPKDIIDFHNMELQARFLVYDKRYAEAQSVCEKMVLNRPQFFMTYLHLAEIAMGKKDFASAVPHLSKTLELKPDQHEAHGNMGVALIKLGRIEEAIEHLNEAIRLKPDSAKAHNDLGIALARQKKFDEAIASFEKALELDPDIAETHKHLGTFLRRKDRLDEAIKHYKESLRLEPEQALVLAGLGYAYYQQEKLELAVLYWTEALQLRQDWPLVLSNLALVRATYEDEKSYDPNEALRLARQACELSGYEDPRMLSTLATAFAAAQDFPSAVETAEKAIELARLAEQNELVAEIQKRLELFKAGQPYRKVRQSESTTSQ